MVDIQSQETGEDISILNAGPGGHYVIKIESDVDKVCMLDIWVAIVPDRRCPQQRYFRMVTEEEYQEYGERLYLWQV